MMMRTQKSQNRTERLPVPIGAVIIDDHNRAQGDEAFFVASDVRICFQVLDGCGLEGDASLEIMST
jgi:hypothetical protein